MLEEYSNQDPFTNGKSIDEYITEFVKEKLKEQRELCRQAKVFSHAESWEHTRLENEILNAPEPEL